MTRMQDPDAVLDWIFDWSEWLDTDNGETIINNEVTVDGITLDTVEASDTRITVWLSSGVGNEVAEVSCKITTSANRIDERTIRIWVKER